MPTPHFPVPARTARRDGWTPARRLQFLEALAAGLDVRRACATVGLSREGAYNARRRDPKFADEWESALQTAAEAERAAFLLALPECLLRTVSELSGLCELPRRANFAQDSVVSVERV